VSLMSSRGGMLAACRVAVQMHEEVVHADPCCCCCCVALCAAATRAEEMRMTSKQLCCARDHVVLCAVSVSSFCQQLLLESR
jgi:hypothetical protein